MRYFQIYARPLGGGRGVERTFLRAFFFNRKHFQKSSQQSPTDCVTRNSPFQDHEDGREMSQPTNYLLVFFIWQPILIDTVGVYLI